MLTYRSGVRTVAHAALVPAPARVSVLVAVVVLACPVALPAGVYVAMNGQVFPWDNVTKNRSEGVFQQL